MTEPGLEGVGILIVDDEVFIRDVTAGLVTDLSGRRPLEASGGREALSRLNDATARIDLMICDLMMPDMDGVELVRHLAERGHPPAIIFLSGGQSSLLRAAETLARAYRLDVLSVLAKPVRRAALLDVLKGFAARHELNRAYARANVGTDDLEKAIERNELCFYYQPKVSLKDHKLDSVEALVRWRHPEHGLLSPAAFVALAEAGPLITPMTEYLVGVGFRQAAAWQRENLHIPVAINLSPSTLSDVSMPDRFAALAGKNALKPRDIIFEITETGIAKNEAVYLEIVTRLHMKGFRLSIDDFGTGQSSLQKLEALPFSELKIDRQFVHGAHKSDAKRAILEASIRLAQAFELKTIAEGAEEPEDLSLLRELGCDVVQGYVYSKPLPEAEVSPWATAPIAEPSVRS